jgi:N-acylglucosamine-6-phosphate 2-epimerase
MTLLPRGGLIVSCQARADNPLHGPAFMAAMAQAAEQGGAVAIRANGSDDIRAIVAATALPVIGIHKVFSAAPVYITPDAAAVRAVIAAGARIVALDCTERPREGDPWRDLIALARALGAEVMADIATRSEGRAAAEAGATYVATTLAGYTEDTVGETGPNLALVAALAGELSVPVVAEGRIATPEDAAEALDAGAHAVVVGTAITNPREITRRFVAGLSDRRSVA